MKKRAACYCRVSTKKEEQLQSMEMQKQYFTEYFEKNSEYELYKIYADEGVSGRSLKNRKEFKQMIKDAAYGYFDIILVKDFSRLSRNTSDLLNAVEELKKHDVKIRFVNYNMESNEGNDFFITVMGAVAQEEAVMLSKKLKLAKRQTATYGRVPNFVFGYDRIDKYKLVPNKFEAGWVKKIFELYVNEGYGTARIAEHLNNNGVKTKRKDSKGWSQYVVSRLLRNELYIGKVHNRKSEVIDYIYDKRRDINREHWITVERPEFQIIDCDLFNKAQKILKSRRNSFNVDNRRPSTKHPLSNLLECANDGYSFRRCVRKYSHSGRTYAWWTCSYRNSKGVSACNNNIRLDEKDMHNAIIDFLKSFIENKERYVKTIKSQVEKELKRRYENVSTKRELNAELNALENEESLLLELYTENIVRKDALYSKLRPIMNRIEEVKAALAYEDYEKIGIDIDKYVTDIFTYVSDNLENVLNNPFLKTVFRKFIVHEDGRIVAVINVDYDLGETIDVPFAEVDTDDEDSFVPDSNNSSQGYDREAL